VHSGGCSCRPGHHVSCFGGRLPACPYTFTCLYQAVFSSCFSVLLEEPASHFPSWLQRHCCHYHAGGLFCFLFHVSTGILPSAFICLSLLCSVAGGHSLGCGVGCWEGCPTLYMFLLQCLHVPSALSLCSPAIQVVVFTAFCSRLPVQHSPALFLCGWTQEPFSACHYLPVTPSVLYTSAFLTFCKRCLFHCLFSPTPLGTLGSTNKPACTVSCDGAGGLFLFSLPSR
jgi:hypothetical protein